MSETELHVLFMPAVDADLSNFLHSVAPDRQHNASNWKVKTGDNLIKGTKLFELEYQDLSSRGIGFWNSLADFFTSKSRGSFELNCPVDGKFHLKDGFYSSFSAENSSKFKHIDSIDVDSPKVSIGHAMYAFHVVIEGPVNLFPYDFYRPWFDFIDNSRDWMEASIRQSDGSWKHDWYTAVSLQKQRFQTLPCRTMEYQRFIELLKEAWGDDSRRPDWLN